MFYVKNAFEVEEKQSKFAFTQESSILSMLKYRIICAVYII